MNRHLLAVLNTLLLALVMVAAIVPTERAIAAEETEDILYMADGRELHGQIISESPTQVVFELTDRVSGWRATLTFDPANIVKIDRDVAVAAPEKPAAPKPEVKSSSSGTSSSGNEAEGNSGLPKIYVIPMQGQMGTDVHVEVYRELVPHIREIDPDYIVLTMDCKDTEDRIYSRIPEDDHGRHHSEALDSYRELVSFFRDELRDVEQIMWVHDSVGISSVVALAWDKLYMKPNARLGGLHVAAMNFLPVQRDENMFGKFREAYMAWLKGFVEYGGYDLSIVDAMVLAETKLSASFRGREVKWHTSLDGDYLVDDDDEATVGFYAQAATNLMISQGIAEDLDDLAFLLGMREFEVIDGRPEDVVDSYTENWRRTYENSKQWFGDYEQHMGWATGAETLKWLGQAKNDLEQIRAAMERYQAVEVRWLEDFGLDKLSLDIQIDLLKERIKSLRRTGRGGARGGGGVGVGGGGPRPGGG